MFVALLERVSEELFERERIIVQQTLSLTCFSSILAHSSDNYRSASKSVRSQLKNVEGNR